jgi:hypothetical protein
MKKSILILVNLILVSQLSFSQSTEIRPGIVLPQMTTAQRTALAASNGMLVFDTNTQSYWLRSSGAWTELPKTAANTNFWQQTGTSGNEIKNTNSGGFWSSDPTGLTIFSDNTSNPPTAPVSGAGTRMMWIPSRSAFRVGTIVGSTNEWDAGNIGLFSFASGYNTLASGKYSTAIGSSTIASGVFSTAMGSITNASGAYSTAMGYSTTASQYSSTAMGINTTASGGYSTAMGDNTTASGPFSTAMGQETIASGSNSTAMGIGTIASGTHSTAMGRNTIASGINSTAIGEYNVDDPNALLMVGDGISGFRITVLNVKKGGFVGLGTDNPIANLHVASLGGVTTALSSYFNPGQNSLSVFNSSGANLGIYANYGIVSGTYVGAAQSVTASDIRIKNIINRSDNATDLARLRQLQITNYRMKDEGTWGTKIFKKVIAQEVEKIYPEAVNKQSSVIPDIYALAEKVAYDSTKKELIVSMVKSYDLKIGDKIELVHPQKGKIRSTISAVNGNDFTVKDWYDKADKIFVFGREVDDFRVVDYEALSMLGISAIQALAKENEEMKAKNKTLESRIEKLENFFSTQNGGK